MDYTSIMSKALSGLDHVMWNINSPKSPNTITGIMRLNHRISPEVLKTTLGKRLLSFEKFRQKVVDKNGWPHWDEDTQFDMDAHVHNIALPEPGDYATLQELIGHLIAIPIDTSKPLWKVHLIDGYEGDCVVLWRIQHAIGDGIALVKVVFSVTASSAAESLLSLSESEDPEEQHEEDDWLNKVIQNSNQFGEDIRHLWESRNQLAEKAKDFLGSSFDLGKWLLGRKSDGPAKMYMGDMSVLKLPAWSTEPIELHIIKQFGKQHGATVNDVLLTMLTGALRSHLQHHGHEPEKGMMVSCPVNLRRKDEQIRVENKVGSMVIELPVQLADFHQRLEVLKEQTQRLKHSLEPVIVYHFIKMMGDRVPRTLEEKFADYLKGRISAVVTNVPGPKEAVYLAGERVKDLMFWVPQTQTMGMGVSIISYNNKVYIGVVTDPNIVKDPDYIIQAFQREAEWLASVH